MLELAAELAELLILVLNQCTVQYKANVATFFASNSLSKLVRRGARWNLQTTPRGRHSCL